MRFWKPILVICCIAAAVFFLRKAGLTGCPFACCPAPVPVATLVTPVAVDEPSTESPRRLIESVSDKPVEWTGRNPAAQRARRIVPDSSWMTPEPVLKAGDVITLELFSDAVFDAEIRNVTRYPNGSVGMTAHLTGDKNGTVYLSYSDGRMLASVEVFGSSDYAVLAREDIHYAIEVDQADSENYEGLPPRVPDAVSDDITNADAVADGNVIGAPEGSIVIDVMLVYTPEAKAWADESNSGIANVMNLAMERANEVHANSGTHVYLHRVHEAQVDYTESTASKNYDVDLDSLTDIDGVIDNVHSLRDEYAADLVCMLAFVTNYGGYGWVLNNTNGSPDSAFCVARVQQAWNSTYTVVHEWGHNMGCGHSTNQTVQAGPATWNYWPENTWSAGWQWDDLLAHVQWPYATDGFCTVMTYEDSNDDGTNEYERVAYFSNPTNYYVGNSTNATGDAASGDNARTIRETRAVIADYREAPDKDYDGLPNEWELQYFGGETNATAGTDDDGDGFSNLEEYISGFNPTNGESFFAVDSFSVPQSETDGFVVQWAQVSGRVYSVNWTTNLPGSFQPLETNILSPQASWTDTVHSSEAKGFYRVDVQLAE